MRPFFRDAFHKRHGCLCNWTCLCLKHRMARHLAQGRSRRPSERAFGYPVEREAWVVFWNFLVPGRLSRGEKLIVLHRFQKQVLQRGEKTRPFRLYASIERLAHSSAKLDEEEALWVVFLFEMIRVFECLGFSLPSGMRNGLGPCFLTLWQKNQSVMERALPDLRGDPNRDWWRDLMIGRTPPDRRRLS